MTGSDLLTATTTRSVRAIVRQATAEQHEALHRHPHFAALLNNSLSLDAYRVLLSRLYGFHRPMGATLDDALKRWFPCELEIKASDRSPLLRQDLLDLGLTERAIEGLPRLSNLPPLHSADHVMGALYVLEGAKLGGRLIHRKLHELFDGELHGRRFFSTENTERDMSWGMFCDQLERFCEPSSVRRIVLGAQSTFTCFARWLDGLPALDSNLDCWHGVVCYE